MKISMIRHGQAPETLLRSGVSARSILVYIAASILGESGVGVYDEIGKMIGKGGSAATARRGFKELEKYGWAAHSQKELIFLPAFRAPIEAVRQKEKKEDPEILMGFELFWTHYPRKVAKQDARRVWLKMKPDGETLGKILADVEIKAASDDWKKEDQKFCPHADRYLRGRRWEDEGPASSPKKRRLVHL